MKKITGINSYKHKEKGNKHGYIHPYLHGYEYMQNAIE